ncbi:MAG: hypothetical protein IPF99_35565 [Deltaproteobacteria bacterium]|nr:hypothetical protein [Deltaproteobacteria bacterium]
MPSVEDLEVLRHADHQLLGLPLGDLDAPLIEEALGGLEGLLGQWLGQEAAHGERVLLAARG